jgi:hypothetical protein
MFKLSRLRVAQQKGGVAGKTSWRVNKVKKKSYKEVIPNHEIKKPTRVNHKPKKQKNISSRDVFEAVRFRSQKTHLMGKERGKITTKPTFEGDQALDYDPFSNALGEEVVGFNDGGDDIPYKKPPETIVKPKYHIRKSSGNRIGKVFHAEAYPPINAPESTVQYNKLVKIKSR